MTLVKNTSSMGKRDKGRKVSQTVAAPPKQAGSSSKIPGPSSIDKGKGKAKVSDELRQAVKDLGGDDEDLDLIAGVDSDGEEPAAKVPKSSTSGSEKDVRKALKEFMKGMDFEVLAAARRAEESDSEEEEDENEAEDHDDNEEEEEADEEDEDDEEEDDDDEDEEDEEDEGEEDEVASAPAEAQAAPAAALRKKSEATSPVQVSDPHPTSGSIVPGATSWWTLTPPLPALSAPLQPLPAAKLNTLRQRATTLLETLPPLSRVSSTSDAAFISQILQSGTHQDKLAALVLLIRDSPLHAVKELSRLRAMAGWKEEAIGTGGGNKDQRLAVVKALADWWVTGGGKESGKLRYFADQPLIAHPGLTDRHLLMYAFEDYLKKWFFNILQVIEVFSHDTLPYVRMQALHLLFQLLQGNAEQEQNLLRLGANKLGDTDKSVASRTSHHLLQLLQAHPAMKAVVAREVSALVLKPASATTPSAAPGSHVRFDDEKPASKPTKNEATNHARYYGLITLNQMTLSRQDGEVAGRLVELYFEIFREILGEGNTQKDETRGNGDELDADQVEKVAGKVGKWRGRRKGAKPKGGRRTAADAEAELVDTSEAKLVAAVLTGINRALPFAKLDETLFTKYMDTLFKITHSGTFNTSIQALTLIFQVSQARQTVSDRFYRTLYESLFDQRLVQSSKQAMYLNLLFKALKADTVIARVMAFVKRLLQMLGVHQPPFISGALYLLGELFSTTPGLKRMLIEPEDNEDEHFVDAGMPKKAGESSKAPKNDVQEYDGKKREPRFAHADSSCLWELLPFVDHFHPSVSLQASQLLNSQPLTGSSDISLNTLVSFLDRFVYRNPKKHLQPKGASIMQPAAAMDRSGQVTMSRGARSADVDFVNSEKFWQKKVADVPVDQLFFHKYFSDKLAKKGKKKAGKAAESDEGEDEDEDVEDAASKSSEGDIQVEEEAEDSDPEEAEIWKAMQASMPDAGDDMDLSDDDSDEELDMSDSGEEVDDEEEGEDEDEEEDGSEAEGSGSEEVDEFAEDEDEDEDDEADEEAEAAADSDGFPDVEEDEDDLVPMDEMPDIVLGGEESGEDEAEEAAKGKRKRKDERKERRKKRKELPVFGSYEDYQALIEGAASEED